MTYDVYPEDIGLKRGDARDVVHPSTRAANAQLVVNVLSGKDRSACRDLVLLNTASILYLAAKVKDLKDGYEMAGQAVDDGSAVKKLKQLVTLSGGAMIRLESFLNSTVKEKENVQ